LRPEGMYIPEEHKTIIQLTKIIKELDAFLSKGTKESNPVGVE